MSLPSPVWNSSKTKRLFNTRWTSTHTLPSTKVGCYLRPNPLINTWVYINPYSISFLFYVGFTQNHCFTKYLNSMKHFSSSLLNAWFWSSDCIALISSSMSQLKTASKDVFEKKKKPFLQLFVLQNKRWSSLLWYAMVQTVCDATQKLILDNIIEIAFEF